MHSFAAAHGGYGRGTKTGCCRAFPWVPLFCLTLFVVGTPIWVLFSYSAASSTSTALSALSALSTALDQATITSALGTLGMVRLVVLALLIIAAVAVLAVSVLQALRRARRVRGSQGAGAPTLRVLLAGDGFAAFMLWVVLLGGVVLLALTATWFFGSWAADALLSTAAGYSTTVEKAASRAVDSAQTLIEQLKQAQLNALDTAPQEVKDSPWYKDFKNGVNNFNQTIAAVVSTPSSAGCQPDCISLDFLAGLAGLNSTCICLMKTLHTMQQGFQATKQATMYSLVGLLLVYLGTSWLLMHFASDFTSTRRDLKDHRRMAKSSSTGEGLDSPGRISPGADASIDIRAADSPLGYKGPTVALPRGSQHDYPYVHSIGAEGPRHNGVKLPHV